MSAALGSGDDCALRGSRFTGRPTSGSSIPPALASSSRFPRISRA